MTHSTADAEAQIEASGADAPAETTLSRKEMRALRESQSAPHEVMSGASLGDAVEAESTTGAESLAASETSTASATSTAQPGVVTGNGATVQQPDSDAIAPAEDAADDARPAATKEKERGLIRYIGNALMGALLVILLLVGAAAIVVPAATGSTALTVMTSSMEPGLPPGTLVVVKPTAPADIREGMVLTYQLSSGDPTLITHRVVQQLHVLDGSYLWITQGDNNPSPDLDPVQEVQVKGTVWYAIPYLGWVSAGLTGEWKAWLLPIAVLALFGYAGWMLISSIRDKARKRRDA